MTITTVSSEGMAEFVNKRLPVTEQANEKADDPAEGENTGGTGEGSAEDAENDEQPEVDAGQEKKPVSEKQNGINKRFKELTDQRKAAEARAEAAERKAAELEAATKKQEPQGLKNGEPDPAKYEDQRTYFKDLARWEIRQEQAEQEAKAAEQKRVNTWREKMDKVRAEQPDYDEVIQNTASENVNDLVRDEIMESDNGPQILRYFAENPDFVRDFNKMTVAKQIAKVAKLDTSFDKPKEVKEVKAEAKVSSAPPPREPIGSGKGSITSKFDAAGNWTGSQSEFEAWYKKQYA